MAKKDSNEKDFQKDSHRNFIIHTINDKDREELPSSLKICYNGGNPMQVSKKIFTQICKVFNIVNESCIFSLQEKSSKKKDKIFSYRGERKRVRNKDGKFYTETIVKSYKEKDGKGDIPKTEVSPRKNIEVKIPFKIKEKNIPLPLL